MGLKIYSIENAKSHRAGYSSIRFHYKGGINISAAAADQIPLGPGDEVIICQDEDRPEDWYLKIVDKKDGAIGFKLRQSSNSANLAFNCAYITNTILKYFGKIKGENYKSISFPLSTEPEVIDNKNYYAIITKKIFK